MGLSNDQSVWDWVVEDTFSVPSTACVTEIREYTTEFVNKYARYVKVVAVDYYQSHGSGFHYIGW